MGSELGLCEASTSKRRVGPASGRARLGCGATVAVPWLWRHRRGAPFVFDVRTGYLRRRRQAKDPHIWRVHPCPCRWDCLRDCRGLRMRFSGGRCRCIHILRRGLPTWLSGDEHAGLLHREAVPSCQSQAGFLSPAGKRLTCFQRGRQRSYKLSKVNAFPKGVPMSTGRSHHSFLFGGEAFCLAL